MGRSKTAACKLLITVEEIRNLPKVNKGSGGADPYGVLEILDASGIVLVGGDRELYCAGCKTKVMKKSLDGYVTERFELGAHSAIVRGGAKLRIRIMDFKPSPQLPKGIAFVDIQLKDLAEKGGEEAETVKLDLMALGEIVTTYGNKTGHGEILLGYKSPTTPAFVVVTLQLTPPVLKPAEGVPLDAQLPSWKFHLLDPELQDEYDMKMAEMRKEIEAQKEAQKRLENERIEIEQRNGFEKRMQMRVQEPSKRTNWRELQELMTNELMRREWGYTMDKSSGVGGWRRPPGSGMQEARNYEAERSLVLKYITYKQAEISEDQAVQEFVAKRRANPIGEMTDHLSEWADPGGRQAAELHPGSKSLGAAVCHVLPTANLMGRKVKEGSKQRPKSRLSSRGGVRAADGELTEGDEGVSGLVWEEGRVAGEAVSYLKPGPKTFGFEELKEAVLLELTGGQQKNAWRDAIEVALSLSVTELNMSSFFTGQFLSEGTRNSILSLTQELQQESLGVKGSNTVMISKIDFEDLVASLEEELEEIQSNRPTDSEELAMWKVGVSYLEKLLEDADKNLEKAVRIREVAQGHATHGGMTQSPKQSNLAISSSLLGSTKLASDVDQARSMGMDGMKPDGSTLKDISVSRTPAVTMTERGLVFTAPAPGVGERRRWQIENVNGKDYLYPMQPAKMSGSARSSETTVRLATQQIVDTAKGEQVKMLQGDSLRPRVRSVNFGSGRRGSQPSDIVQSDHVYVPPGKEVWGTALKSAHGRRFTELDMMNDVRFLSSGGSISLGTATNRPRPDTSTTRLERTPMTNCAKIEVHPDTPGGGVISMEARFAVFGKKGALSAAIVNAALPPDGSSLFANHAKVGGKIALFDVPLTDQLLSTDLGLVCARQAEESGACAAMFILDSDELITAAGSNNHINPVGIPVFTIGKSEGDRLKTWIQPPVRFNPPYVSISIWTPEWLLPMTSAENTPEFHATESSAYQNLSERLVRKWREALRDDEEGQVWMEGVRTRIGRELGLEDIDLLKRGLTDVEHLDYLESNPPKTSDIRHQTSEPQIKAPNRAESAREGMVSFGADDEDEFELAGMAARKSADFSAATGTLLQMSQTLSGVVELRRGVALIISNASHLLPSADGSSRDLPGLERDVEELENMLPKLGFKVFSPQRNRNADEVWSFLRRIKRGFDAGGALVGFDSLVVFITGQSNGQSIECAVDDAGQVGSLGIQLLMELFNDQNCPGLKGKLKIFILSLSLGHPVHSPGTAAEEQRSKSTLNVLNSIETGGTARVCKCTSAFADLVIREDWLQGQGGCLRDDEGEFQDHVSLSYRRVPYSGTFWKKKAAAGKGEIVIDLGKVVEDIDTFSVFQQPFGDGKCTAMWLRHAKSDHVGDEPPQLSQDWEWINVTDTEGNLDIPLFDTRDPTISSGSIMGASRIFRTAPFSSRWLRVEMKNNSTHGSPSGVGLRQIKAFKNPRSTSCPAHEPGKPTWVENPAEGVGGPALNRVGADSVFPMYQMPVYAFAGKPKAIQGAIGLSSDYSLLCYCVPVGGVSNVPTKGSHILSSLVRLLESSHHKHVFQTLLSDLLQGLVDDSCARFGPAGYREQVRLLQRTCNADDFPVMLSLGQGRPPAQGVPGEFDSVAGHRHYEDDVPEPRNVVRDVAVKERSETSSSLQSTEFDLRFHPRLRSDLWEMLCGGITLVKLGKGPKNVAALALALPVTDKTMSWQFTVGTLAVLGGNTLSVPKLCVGVVARKAARRLNLESYQLGDDADSWGLQTGALTSYKNHAGSAQRLIGISFTAGDVITCILNVGAGTLSFSVNGEEESIPPFTGLPVGGVIPAISSSGDTAASVTIATCRTLST